MNKILIRDNTEETKFEEYAKGYDQGGKDALKEFSEKLKEKIKAYQEAELSGVMTLDEAIDHAKEVAKSKCDKCGEEHKQLAEWLEELKRYRELRTAEELEKAGGENE